jgi:hypothetical protein
VVEDELDSRLDLAARSAAQELDESQDEVHAVSQAPDPGDVGGRLPQSGALLPAGCSSIVRHQRTLSGPMVLICSSTRSAGSLRP